MKEIAELKEANEILKDAMSFFVKDHSFAEDFGARGNSNEHECVKFQARLSPTKE